MNVGEGTRWYDWPYRKINWLLNGKRAKIIPKKLARFLRLQLINIEKFNEYEGYNLVTDKDSQYYMNSISEDNKIDFSIFWAVEFFTPTNIKQLDKVLKDLKIQQIDDRDYPSETIDEVLEIFRNENTTGEFTIGYFTSQAANQPEESGFVTKLPSEFETISLSGVQVTSSITAVIVRFNLKSEYEKKLNSLLHMDNKASYKFRDGLLRVYNRGFTKYNRIQEFIEDTHKSAKEWMTHTLKGHFASSGEDLPIFEFYLTERNKKNTERESVMHSVLGVDEYGFGKYQHIDHPSLYYYHNSLGEDKDLFIGDKSSFYESLVDKYGEEWFEIQAKDKPTAIFKTINRELSSNILLLAMTRLLKSWTRLYSQERDRISEAEEKFKIKNLKLIRNNLTSLSFNISNLNNEFDYYRRSREKRLFSKFLSVHSHNEDFRGKSLHKETLDNQKRMITELVKMDKNYRNIISSIASIGETIENYKISRLALLVALVSLIVSLIAIPYELWIFLINLISN